MSLVDEESEKVIVGSLIQDSSLYHEINRVLKPEDFYFEPNKILFSMFDLHSSLDESENSVDDLVLINMLKERGLLEKVGNRSYIYHLAEYSSPLAAFSTAKRLRDLSVRRTLLKHFRTVEKKISDGSIDLNSILETTENGLMAIQNREDSVDVQHIENFRTGLKDHLKSLKEARDRGGVTGERTRFKEFDNLTSGLKGGQMIVLAARPGIGKTTFALNLASNICLHEKRPVLFYSLEMGSMELLLRLICAEALIDSQKVQKGFISNKELEKIVATANFFFQNDFYLDDTPGLDTFDFRQRSRRLAQKLRAQGKSLGFIVVDYLQLMTSRMDSFDGRMMSRQIEVQNISRTLKLIAKELNVPVLAVSQMNRSIEQRGKDPRPQLSDLRESGAIEQDADLVMFIHREDFFNKEIPETEQKQAEVIIAKHRAGPTGNFKLAFLKEYNRFLNLDKNPEGQSY